MAAPGASMAEALFEDVGRKVAEASKAGDLDDGDTKLVEEIESLCMNCHENGTTKLLLTKIPFFREVVLMSFDCPSCGFKNSEIQSAGEIQQRGVRYVFKPDSPADLNRQIVKSDSCVIRFVELDLEVPAGRGVLTNVEGILTMVKDDLAEKQPERKEAMPQVYARIEEIVAELAHMATGEKLPFTIHIDDPAGNSWIEPSTDNKAGKYSRHEYARNAAQNAALGLADTGKGQDDREKGAEDKNDKNGEKSDQADRRPEYRADKMYLMPSDDNRHNVDDEDIIENKVYTFQTGCPGCQRDCATNMKMVNIPHFKQVVIMSTTCDVCGYRSNEVKTGGDVPEKGRRITVSIETAEDLTRDILKSESCAMECPELDLTVQPGTLGGRFTTVEGILSQMRDDLHSSIFDMSYKSSDSMALGTKEKWDNFFARLDAGIRGEIKFSIVLEDPLAASYVQSFAAPGPDERMKVEDYDRTAEEEEEMGLADIKTENYEES